MIVRRARIPDQVADTIIGHIWAICRAQVTMDKLKAPTNVYEDQAAEVIQLE
jgi:hypothetical protein